MNKTIAIIFSYKRPLQCDLTLQSLVQNCTDCENLDIKVLYKADDERWNNAYLKLARENPSVEFIKEVSFHTNINVAIINYQYTMFITDDTIFTHKFSIKNIEEALADTSVLGFSLRLGFNTTYCYPVDKEQHIPEYVLDKNVVLWDWQKAELDFAYPLELSSSVYRTWDILKILNWCLTIHPNSLEFAMDSIKGRFTESSKMACYKQSVGFAAPINKIREENKNRAGINPEYAIDLLLTKFENGDRIDPKKFFDFESNACHQEITL
jgi:hypothetical protein